jgi:O-antigen ligase
VSWGRVRTGAAGVAMALLLVALPLVFSKQVYAIVFTPKVVVLYLAVAALVIALAAAGLERGGIELRLTVVELIALALLGWGLVSALFAVSRVTGFFGLLNWGTGWLFWVASLVIWATVRRLDFSERGRLVALWTGFVAASVLGLLALLQVVGAQSVLSWLPGMVGGRPGATIGNPIYFGAYMALMLLVGLELSLRAKAMAVVVISNAGLVLVTVGLVGSLSRGPWLGAVAGVVVWTALRARDRTVRGGLVVPLAVVVVVVAVFAWQLPHLSDAALSVGTRVEGSTPSVSATGEPNTIATRVELWKVAAAATLDRPVVGWGPGNFVTAGRQHMTAKLTGAEQARFADAHNLYAEFSATWGIPGLLLLLAWFGAVSVQLWRAERGRLRLVRSPAPGPSKGGRGAKVAQAGMSGGGRRKGRTASGQSSRDRARGPSPAARGTMGLAPLGLATLGTFLVSSLSTPQHIAVASTTMVIVGLSLSWRQGAALPGARVFSPASTKSRAIAIAGLVASVALLGVVCVAGYRLVQGDARYAKGITASTSAGAVNGFQGAANAVPWIERYWIALGDTQGILAGLGHDPALSRTAAANLRRGLDLSPRDLEGLLSLSRVLLDLQDSAGAKVVAEEAAAYAPFEARAHASLARALAATGERDRALAELDRALAGSTDARVLVLAGLAYRELGDKVKAIELLNQVQAAGYNDPVAARALAELTAGG